MSFTFRGRTASTPAMISDEPNLLGFLTALTLSSGRNVVPSYEEQIDDDSSEVVYLLWQDVWESHSRRISDYLMYGRHTQLLPGPENTEMKRVLDNLMIHCRNPFNSILRQVSSPYSERAARNDSGILDISRLTRTIVGSRLGIWLWYS